MLEECLTQLGRDFISKRNIQVILNQKITIKKVSKNDLHNNDVQVNEILPINCINEIDECDKLEINPDINHKYIDTVKQFYRTYYLSNL